MREIRIEHLRYVVEEKQILQDISLTLGGHEFVGLIGPNGCGKSTLLKHLYRVNPIQQGQIYFDDVLIMKDGNFVLEDLKKLNAENLK